MNLPLDFEKRMQRMLGDDYPAFLAAYDRPNTPALRVNPMKAAEADEAALLPCMGTTVPWARYGYYYDPNSDLRPGKHPYHDAGVYYIQEASAMIPASLCPPAEGERVLDLCAAPGGKSTQLAGYLKGTGLLVANEINPSRAAILSQNIERLGISNAVVTNHAPAELATRFPCFFDKIVVDAPCSGEGMFRKEEQALTMWSQYNVDMCAERQLEILHCAADMLKPDGYLTYSTCTFAPEENEGVLLEFLRHHQEFEVVAPQNPDVLACLEKGLLDRGNPQWVEAPMPYAEQLKNCVRLFPHHADGEGHFAALLHKSPHASAETQDFSKSNKKDKGKGKKTDDTSALNTAMSLFDAFAKDVLKARPEGKPCLFGEQLYLIPGTFDASCEGLRILRCGLHLGTVKNKRFDPSHALALALSSEDVVKVMDISADSPQMAAYLHGDTIPCDVIGWHLMLVDCFSIGWGKASGGMMKNHYPKGLRKA